MGGCPYLETGKKGSICTASLTSMVASIFEIDTYCTTEEHYRCPILLANILRKGGGWNEKAYADTAY